MTDALVDTFKNILEEDQYCLSAKGDKCEGYEVLDRVEGEDRRWSRYVDVYVKFPDDRIFKWTYDEGLTEIQEDEYPWSYGGDGKWDPEPVEVEQYTETLTVTRYREKK